MIYLKKYEIFERYKPAETTKGEYFHFLTKGYDVEMAWDLIRNNPEKYLQEDGSYYELPVDDFYELVSRTFDENGVQVQNDEREDGKSYKTKIGISVDRKIANNITEEELKDPVIFVMDGDFHMLIDGWKRIYKAKKLGIKTINCYVIKDETDLKKIRMR
jgi:hypothetical protein